MRRALGIMLAVGAIAGVMALFGCYVGYEMYLDWKRGRRLRRVAGDTQLADQAVGDFQLQTELDDALIAKGLAGYKRLHPVEFQKAMRPDLRVVR